MFIDGSMIGDPVNITRSIHNSTAPLRISSYDSSAGNNRPLDGWVEDFRFVVGEALYTENFPLPTEPLASELPPPPGPVATTTVLPDGEGNNPGIDEGRAMMQLIHDVAPDADLSFHTAFNGLADFAQGIIDLADDGADVIVDDIIYFAEPMFQDGIVAQAVDNVVSQGVAYFSSAGNSAQRSYDAPFQASGERLFVGDDDRGMLHDFNPGPGGPVDYLQSVTIPVGTTFIAVLQWDQPFASNCPNPQPPQGCPGPDNDADIYLVEKSGNNLQIVTSSITDNLTTGDPVEVIQFQNPGFFFGEDYHIMITHFDVVTPQHPQPGPPPGRLKYVWFASPSVTVNEHTTDSPASYGHANASGAEAVGAAFYLDTPGGDPNGVLPEPILDPILEWFSSVGGVPILFDKNGNPQAPEVRQKPEIVAPDGTNTTFFGSDTSADDDDEAPETFPNFFGTSAAAPHAAAIAALMLEANPGLSPAQIYSGLEDTALDILQRRAVVRSDPLVTIPNGVGVDDHSGYGLIDATAAIANVTGDLLPLANDDSATTGIDAPVAIDVLGDDAYGDGLTQFTIVSGPANGGAVINDNNTPGLLDDDYVDYTPNPGFIGTDTFDYRITDPQGQWDEATVTVTVNDVDVLPSAEDDGSPIAIPIDEDPADPVRIDVLANDNLGNEPTTIVSAGPTSTNGGTVTIVEAGAAVTYQPFPDYNGPDSFVYTIEDADGDPDPATVSISVNPVNDPPAFENDPIVKLNAVADIPYTGQTLAGEATDPENNSLTYSWVAGPTWLDVDGMTGALSGTPRPEDTGPNLFTVRVTDNGSPAESGDATLSIFVEEPAPASADLSIAAVDSPDPVVGRSVDRGGRQSRPGDGRQQRVLRGDGAEPGPGFRH
jgi:hypothetical protein